MAADHRNDIVIVGKNDETIVVEVKRHGKPSMQYGLPRKTLNVMFKSRGVVRPASGTAGVATKPDAAAV